MHIKLTVTLIIAYLASSLVYSQKKLEVTYKRNDDKTIDFYFKKKNPESTYVITNFNRFDNAKGKRLVKKTIKGFSGSLLRLEPLNEKRGLGFHINIRI